MPIKPKRVFFRATQPTTTTGWKHAMHICFPPMIHSLLHANGFCFCVWLCVDIVAMHFCCCRRFHALWPQRLWTFTSQCLAHLFTFLLAIGREHSSSSLIVHTCCIICTMSTLCVCFGGYLLDTHLMCVCA